jgi:hypothetical protein
VHKQSKSINLASCFADEEGDPLTMTATYSSNGASAMPIPGGIFTKPADFQIDVASTSIEDTGVYTITLIVSDLLQASFTQAFKVTVTNAPPRIPS